MFFEGGQGGWECLLSGGWNAEGWVMTLLSNNYHHVEIRLGGDKVT